MIKTILITGSTDGIGLETAKLFAKEQHNLIIHGRNSEKLENVKNELLKINPNINIKTFVSDLSSIKDTKTLTEEILKSTENIDVIINNAGVFVADETTTKENIDVRFAVNTISPYLLTKRLLPILSDKGRIVNLSSAAQTNINFDDMKSGKKLSHDSAYAQSKLGITMWSMELAQELGEKAVVISVNPKSFLGSKMVKEAYGRKGYDLSIGADILYKASLSQEFANKTGSYYDNDYREFTNPHSFALNKDNRVNLMKTIDKIIDEIIENNL